jgi:hypothetical protein
VLILSCRKEPAQVEMKMDDVIAEAVDSLYSNLDYSRHLLRKAMKEASDSLEFYNALQAYSLTYFVTLWLINPTRHTLPPDGQSLLQKDKNRRSRFTIFSHYLIIVFEIVTVFSGSRIRHFTTLQRPWVAMK